MLALLLHLCFIAASTAEKRQLLSGSLIVEERPAPGVTAEFAVEDVQPTDILLTSTPAPTPFSPPPTPSVSPPVTSPPTTTATAGGAALAVQNTTKFPETSCGKGCSDHGQCLGGRCQCNIGWNGTSCELQQPPQLPPPRPQQLQQTPPPPTPLPPQQPQFVNATQLWPPVDDNALHGPAPVGRYGHSAEVQTEHMLLFGGSDGERLLNDLWWLRLADYMWLPVPVEGYSPPPRTGAGLALTGEQLLMFGGTDVEGEALSDVWQFSLQSHHWQLQTFATGKAPIGRWGHTLLSHVATQTAVLFGGRDQQLHSLSDCWIYHMSKHKWQPLGNSNSTSPIARFQHAATIMGEEMLMFGGRDSRAVYMNDLWSLNLASGSWSEVLQGGLARPEGKCQHSLASRGDQLWLFGGENENLQRSNELWLFSLSTKTWQLQTSANGPVARISHSMVVVEEQLLLLGGRDEVLIDDLWSHASGSNWQRVRTAGWTMAARWGHCLEAIGDKLLIFGGEGELANKVNDLWEFSLTSSEWSCLIRDAQPQSPEGRTTAGSVILGNTTLWLFGGENQEGQVLGDLWTLDLQGFNWQMIDVVGSSPMERKTHSMLRHGQSFLLFGGSDGNGQELGDLWQFDPLFGGGKWQQLSGNEDQAHTPSARHHPMLLMPGIPHGHGKMAHDGVIVYGGSIHHAAEMQELWMWDLGYGRWRSWKLNAPGPAPRYCPLGAASHGKMVMWGGYGDTESWTDLWRLDIEEKTWHKLHMAHPAPASRQESPIVTFGSRMVFYGGKSPHDVVLGDLWAVDMH